jgi:hypothetical protein
VLPQQEYIGVICESLLECSWLDDLDEPTEANGLTVEWSCYAFDCPRAVGISPNLDYFLDRSTLDARRFDFL